MEYHFEAPLWLWDGNAAWHFVTLPFEVTDEIDERAADTKRGFGSVRVEVSVGRTTWRTSIFPDTKRQSFLLPVKRTVRVAEELEVGALVPVTLSLVD
jgi:hypothetical protein